MVSLYHVRGSKAHVILKDFIFNHVIRNEIIV